MKISVQVKPQSKKDLVEQIYENTYKVYTTKPAKDNKANIAVIELLAKYFNLKKSQVHLLSGTTAKDKVFEIYL
jgi:hypothetical protein